MFNKCIDKVRLRKRSLAFLKLFIRKKIYQVHIIILIKYSLPGRDVLTYYFDLAFRK